MLTTNIHSKACRYVLFTATMVFFASAQGAAARGGGSSRHRHQTQHCSANQRSKDLGSIFLQLDLLLIFSGLYG